LAAFLRARLGEVGDTLAPLWSRRDEARTAMADEATRELAVAVVGAAAPFASTSYGRARLLRQMHASGLLTAREAEQAEQLFGVAQ
jgi:hypothetical protein